jgi:hypothetical protein
MLWVAGDDVGASSDSLVELSSGTPGPFETFWELGWTWICDAACELPSWMTLTVFSSREESLSPSIA